MDLDLVRYRHCVAVYTLLYSAEDEWLRTRPAYLASDLESPYGGVIALTAIKLERDFALGQCSPRIMISSRPW
jgi:hypothetical protein